jgi:hypothetical protein
VDGQLIELKAKIAHEPFRPFVIELVSGRQIVIGSDSEILFSCKRPELIIAFTDDGLQHEFELSRIAALVEAS